MIFINLFLTTISKLDMMILEKGITKMQDNKILWSVITITLVIVFAYSLFFNSPSYTITFHSTGETEITPQTVRRNRTLEIPEDPVRSGFTFVGWELNNELIDLTSEKVTQDMDLVAYWEIIVLTITFDSASGTPIEEIEVFYGDTAEPPNNPTRNNRRFHYWSLDGERFDWETPIYSDIELVAVWRR